MTKGKNLGGGKQGRRKSEVKQGVQAGLFVVTFQVALNLSREISRPGHTSDVPVQECTELGEQTLSLRFQRHGQIAHITGVWPWMEAASLGRMGKVREEGKLQAAGKHGALPTDK